MVKKRKKKLFFIELKKKKGSLRGTIRSTPLELRRSRALNKLAGQKLRFRKITPSLIKTLKKRKPKSKKEIARILFK